MDDFDFDFGDFDFVDENFDYNSLLNNIDWNAADFGVDENFDIGSLLSDVDFNAADFGVDENFDLGPLMGGFSEDVESQAGGFYGNMPGRATYDPTTDITTLYDPTTDTETLISHGGGREILPGFDESEFYRGDLYDDEGAGTVEIVGEKEDTSQEDMGSDFWKDWHGRRDSILTDEEHTRTGGDLRDPYEVDGSQVSREEKDILTPTKPDGPPPRKIVDPDPSCPPNSNKKVTAADGSTKTYDCKGNLIAETGPTTKTVTEPPPKKPISNTTLLTGLLGGLLGLLSKPKGGPAGYRGTIPKYMATRGPARSPTEGGRRPGAAGIGSLTGGVTYTPVGAAGGGLMGLAEGGKARPARYLRGGTDGMADKIQTSIEGKQPARLSHGEFVIPADVVSHLGNGNSDAGADVLYDMMAKVRKARTGTSKQGKQINPRKYTPA